MNDIYTAVKQVIPRAEPRVLSDTENAILRHRQIKPEDDNLPGLWSLYVDDIINRFHQSIGEINPPHLVIDDMPSLDLELRPFLMIGQVFPCDESVRDRLHATKLKRWQLRLKGINTHAIEIWNRLHEFERGENFIILLKSLVQAGREAISDLPSDKHSAFHFSHDLRLIVRPDPFTLASYLVSFPTSASRLFVRQIPKANRLAMEVVQHLILHSDLPESVRPGSGLLNDFARLAAITPPLFRRLQWDHKILTTPLPPSDLASILAKASYAERYGCFFVHQSPFSFAMRTFLIRACYNRRISAWNGEAADEREPLAIRLATDWTGEAAYERELRATQNKLSAPCLFIGEGQSKDFPKTGRLIRCPELYEHLYVTPKADGLNDVAGASDAMRYSQMPFVGDQQTRSGLGMHNEDGPANGKMGITNGYGSRVTINSHVNNFFETRNMPPSEEHKPLSDASVTIHDARGSLTERQLDEPESRPHAQSSLAVGSIDIINGYEGRVHVNSNIHNYGPPTT